MCAGKRLLLEGMRFLCGRPVLPAAAHAFQPCKGSPAVQLLSSVRKAHRVFFGNCTALALPATTLLIPLLSRGEAAAQHVLESNEGAVDSCLGVSHHQEDLLASAHSSQRKQRSSLHHWRVACSGHLTRRVWLVLPSSGTDGHLQGPLIARWQQQPPESAEPL